MPVNSNIDIQDVTPTYEPLETVYTVAGMTFDNEEDMPDLGSIKIIEQGQFNNNTYCCLGVDVDKLNTVFTKAYIGNAFNVGSGSVCIVADTQRAFVYHTTDDMWHEWEYVSDFFNILNGVTDEEARTEIRNLDARIDNIVAHNNDTEGNSELIDIRTGADGINYTSAGASVRNQISSLKSSLIVESKNLFDSSTITENVYPLSTGVLTEDTTETLFTSDYIHVTPSTNYYESSAYLSGTHFICTYDSEKGFIERIIVNNNEWTPLINATVKGRAYTSGSTVCYIRICTTKTLLNTLQLEIGSEYTGYRSHDALTLNENLIIPQLKPFDERIQALEESIAYTLPYIHNGKCMPPAVTTNVVSNKTVGYVFADIGEDCCQLRCQWVFENHQGHSAQLTVYTNPIGCDSIGHITGKGLHLQIYPDYFKLDILGGNYTDENENQLYYYNDLSGGKVYFDTPLACDGETVHTVSIYSNTQGTKIHCIINGVDYSYDYIDQYGYIPTLRDAIGRYVGFEMYGNGRSEDAFPIVTVFRADGYASDGVSPKTGVLLDYFNRQDGQLSVAPTGQIYKLMNNYEYKR